ncbi:MAG TPA: DUF4097 family beta strand repeat-containing protein [Vicinamibacterales bacterium]|nr:DUF4097 family beta strand repeat-containing protein [Vicinamibacterales bacterium]
MSVTLRGATVLAFHALLGLSAAGCVDISAGNAQYIDTVEKRFTVSGTPVLKVGTFDGSVEVATWDKPEVLVTIERHAASRADADRMVITATQDGDAINVDVRDEKTSGFHFTIGPFGARVVVTVPTKATVDASTGDGRINVRDVEGDLTVRTGDGAIRLEHVNGDVNARSGDGSIEIEGAIRRLDARSGDGRVRVHASNGQAAEEWRLATGDGSVVLEVPDGFGAELDATTGDGRVDVRDVPFRGDSDDRHGVARGRIGNGGSRITIRSGDGSITVRRADRQAES